MTPRLITDAIAADLIDASTIAHRIAHGAAIVILGTHKVLGPWTLMQTTTREFYVTSEADPADLGAFLAAA